MEKQSLMEDIPVFDPSLVSDTLTEDAERILDMFRDKVAYISEYMPIKKYDKTIETLRDNMLFGFEHKEFRDFPVQFKFRKDDPDEEVKWLPYRSFLINMIMWRPQYCLDPDNIGDNLIIPAALSSKMGPNFIKEYFDRNYIDKYNRYIPSMPYLAIHEIVGELSEVLGETTFIIQQTTSKFSNFFGLSASIEAFKELGDRIPEIKELMYYQLDETKQPAEMEKDLKNATDTFKKLIVEDNKFTVIKPLFACKSGLNEKQVCNMVINGGLKPNEDGRTISTPINTNFLAQGGLHDVIYYYINGIAGRKAAIINNEFMGRTGHLLILIAICCADIRLSKTCMDCNTINPVPIEIKSKTHLVKMHGRRYKFRGDKTYKILNANTDESLIGETLEFRSPITCACKNGVCRECYGELYYTNADNEIAGIYSATTVMNPVVQGILSAKHHQSTDTSPIEFTNPMFKDFFDLSSTDVILNINTELDATEYCILIRREDIRLTDDDEDLELDFEKKRRRRKRKVVTDDEDEFGTDDGEASLEFAMKYYTTKFYVARNLHTKGKTPEYYEFEDKDLKELFIHNDFILRMSPDADEYGQYLYMEMEDVNPEEFIFLVDVENNELTKPMKEIQKVLNSKDHAGCMTYEEMTNKMLDLMIASKLDATGIHSEMIIRTLVRRKNNTLRRPDFSRLIMSTDVELMTINSALKRNPSITTSMSTPYLKDQLVNLVDTFNKTASSVFDSLFKPCIQTDDDIQRVRELKAKNALPIIEL